MNTSPTLDRNPKRFRVLTAEIVSRLWAEYQERPFNISGKARELGIKPHTLAYHMRGGKVYQALSLPNWRRQVKMAFRAFGAGDRKQAAKCLREAAKSLAGEGSLAG